MSGGNLLSDGQCAHSNESLGPTAYIVADKAKCLYEPEPTSAVRIIPPYGTEVGVVCDEGAWVLIRFYDKEAWSPRENLSADLAPMRPAIDVGILPPPNYAFRSPQSVEVGLNPVEYGPRGGRFVRTTSGFRRYF